MEKDTTIVKQPLSTHSVYEQNAPPPSESAAQEQNADGGPLDRVTTGPPYSIFSPKTKAFIVIAVSISSLISPLGATTFYPALDVLAKDLHVTPTLINLSLTTYMVWLFLHVNGRIRC